MYRKYINIVEAANKGCPIATHDLEVNVKNRQTAIDKHHYGPANPDEPGNYWILDYAPNYSWAIVSDPDGTSGSILTRDQIIPAAEYDGLVARAYQVGVRRTITPTQQVPPV